MPQKITFSQTPHVRANGEPGLRTYFYKESNWDYLPGTRRPDLRKQNVFSLIDQSLVYERMVQGGTSGSFTFDSVLPRPSFYVDPIARAFTWEPVEQTALAKFKGKLKKDSASLGVTLGSWRQSRDMIVHRLTSVSKMLDRAYVSLTRDRKRLKRVRKEREPLANLVLEEKFGWEPLVEDIRNSLKTLSRDIPNSWVRGRHTAEISWQRVAGESWEARGERESYQGTVMVTVAANVTIENPNLFLANQLGLINPATVIWDLVPWSFLVNMFLNVNAMISSVTDYLGMSIKDKSTTRSYDLTYKNLKYSPAGIYGTSESQIHMRYKEREPGSFPVTKWQWRVPKLNWDLAIIASALLLQKAKRLSRLIGV